MAWVIPGTSVNDKVRVQSIFALFSRVANHSNNMHRTKQIWTTWLIQLFWLSFLVLQIKRNLYIIAKLQCQLETVLFFPFIFFYLHNLSSRQQKTTPYSTFISITMRHRDPTRDCAHHNDSPRNSSICLHYTHGHHLTAFTTNDLQTLYFTIFTATLLKQLLNNRLWPKSYAFTLQRPMKPLLLNSDIFQSRIRNVSSHTLVLPLSQMQSRPTAFALEPHQLSLFLNWSNCRAEPAADTPLLNSNPRTLNHRYYLHTLLLFSDSPWHPHHKRGQQLT